MPTALPPIKRIRWSSAYRIVPSRFPPVGVFDRIVDPADLDALVEVVDQLQDRVVERALVGERRLDVPPHQAAEDRLERPALADDRALGGDGPETLRLIPDRQPHLRRCHSVAAGSCGVDLLLEPREERGDLRRLVGHPPECKAAGLRRC